VDFFVVDFAVVAAVVAVSCMAGAVELADIVLVSVADIAAADVSAVLAVFLEQAPSATPASTNTAIAAPSLKVPLTLPPLNGRAAKIPDEFGSPAARRSPGLAATTVPMRTPLHDHLISPAPLP